MPHSKARCKPSLDLLAVFIFALVVFSAVAAAKEVKTYPESGKVIGIGQNEHTKTHPKTGDVIHFRVEKGSAHIALSDGSEQKLRILNEEAKPDAKPAEAKTSDPKQ